MIRNYFKIALRNLLKNKGYSFINLFGLTIGLTCCLVIGFYVWNELSFDRYHTNADRIWRVSRKFFNKDGSMALHLGHLAPPFAPLLKNDFPDIEEATRLYQYTGTFRKDERLYVEDQMFVAEPNFLKIFTVPLVSGSQESALSEPYTLMLSETTAKKYFNDTDPMNQTLRLDGRFLFKITGVYKDFPYNSHFHPDMLASFATLRDTLIYGEEGLRSNWGNNSFSTFLLLPKGYPAKDLETRFPAFVDKNMKQAAAQSNVPKPSTWTSLHLMPLTDIHLHSHLDSEIEENSDINRIYIFSIIALFVLFIACINYMNLSTARSMTRAKEIGIRKSVGAFRGEIATQFLTEAVVLVLASTLLATGLALLLLPFLNDALGQELQVTRNMLMILPAGILGLAFVTGLLAGMYPAVFLSGFRPVQVLKGGISGAGGGALRKVLVVGQFAISAGLIIATLVVFRQLKFMQDKSLGLNKDHIVTMNFYGPLAEKYESFRNEVLSNSAVRNITRSTRLPSTRLLDSFGSAKAQLETDSLEQRQVDLKFITVDHRFAPTYELELAAGRNYLEDQGSDRFESFIVNEAAVRGIGWKSAEEAVGKRIQYGGRDARIVGVYKDFNFESLHQDILPMIFFIPRDSTFFNALSIKVDGARTAEALAHIKTTWQTFMPDFPFDYDFLDASYGQLYEAEQRQGRVFIGFSLIAILVACLGLFGLAAFVAQQRVKEIGVRKVLGATTAGIVTLLSRDFLKLVLVALVIATPLAWFIMNRWLENFAYRIGISWWIFALAAGLALLIAFLTVSFQSVKAALANPVKSLRSE